MKVAVQRSAADPLGAHARDELGHQEALRALPMQAALVSAGSFAIAAGLPIAALELGSGGLRIPLIAGSALGGLGILGVLGGHLGGAPRGRAAIRVLVGGSLSWGSPPSWDGSLVWSGCNGQRRGSAGAIDSNAEIGRAHV